MRILFITPYVPSPIRVRPYNLLKQLLHRHDVTVLTLWQSPRERDDVVTLRALCPTVAVHLGRARSLINCLHALPTRTPLQAAYCRSPRLRHVVQLTTTRRAGDRSELPPELRAPFDVVHLEHLRAAYLGYDVASTTPTLFDSVDCISLLLERTARLSHSRRQRVLARLELGRTHSYEARALGRFDRVIATSPEDARTLGTLSGRDDVGVVRNGVDLDFFRPVDDVRAAKTIVLSGKMSYHANVSAALHFARHIFPLIKHKCPDARLVIAGSDPPTVVRALASDPAISITGHLPDLRDVLRRATVAVCPVTVKVGIQNKVLEAMAMQVPVVCSREGFEGLAARPGVDLLVAGDVREFADHVCSILRDPALATSVGLAGRRYVESNHRWDDAARRLEGLYEEAVECRARALGTRGGDDARRQGAATH